MQAKQELMQLKEKLRKHIAELNAEMDTVDKAIRLLERESASGITGHQDRQFRNSGLSEACRQIVGAEWILPSEVRNKMMQGGYKSASKNANKSGSKGRLLAAV